MSSESDDDDFVTYGTPLEPLNEDEIPKKRSFTTEDQIAKDKYGRRRFHGAFTGGFSAGFFNTVGSLEGWKPSQFTSSREARSQAQVQRAEDFMDEEDMDEFGIAPKAIQPRSDYNQPNNSLSRKRSMKQFSEGPIPGIPVLQTLLEPVRETIGIKLLMKMGWKSGQGVGPRLSKAEKTTAVRLQQLRKVYGCSLPSDSEQLCPESEEELEDTDEQLDNVTFAPDDYEARVLTAKCDLFGLGYLGLDRRPVLSSPVSLFEPASSSLVMEEKKKKVSIRGQAFGVGAFEDEDADIYAKDDMSQYDFALDTPNMLAEKRRQERNARFSLLSSSSPTDILEGFIVATQSVVQKVYPPPPLPLGFRPVHSFKKSRFSTAAVTSSQSQSQLTAIERAVIVNDEVRPQETCQPKIAQTAEPLEVERSASTFRPFVSDPDKQVRYEKFLTLAKQGQSDQLRRLQPLAMTEWEAERERGEFEQAARLYRPLSAAFSDRFVSASQPDDATDPLAPVSRTVHADQDVAEAAKLKMFGRLTRRIGEWHPHDTLCKRFNIPPPGRSSNSVQVKRSRPKFAIFNFLDAATPAQETEMESTNPPQDEDSSKNDAVTSPMITNDQQVEAEVDKDLEKLTESTNKMDLYKAIFLSSSDESETEDEKQSTSQLSTSQSETCNNSSTGRGIFDNLESINNNNKKTLFTNTEKMAKDENTLRNTSPPRGIFANLDKIHLENKASSNKANSSETENNKNEATKNNSELNTSVTADEIVPYGPVLPPAGIRSKPKVSEADGLMLLHKHHSKISKERSSESDSDEWVESNGQRSIFQGQCNGSEKKHDRKTHRKSKKHRKDKKKHKHKKKKSR